MTIILSCFLGAAAAQSIVSNVRVQQSEEQLIVMYDLAEKADIEVHVSFDGGATFHGPLQYVMGSVGKDVSQGTDKVVIWNALREFGEIDYPNAVIKVVAANDSGAARISPQTVLPGTGVPLISRGRHVYGLDREMNQSEFIMFMVNKGYKTMMPLPRYNVQSLMSGTNDFALDTYNRGIKKHNNGEWLLVFPGGIPGLGTPPLLIPGIIVKSQGNVNMRESVAMYNSSINRHDVTQMMFDYNYDKGKKRNRIGNMLLWSGVPVAAFGGFQMIVRNNERHENSYDQDWWIAGTVMLFTGGAMTLTGITFKITGKNQMKQPLSLQNSTNNRVGMELDFGITGNGAGMALRF